MTAKLAAYRITGGAVLGVATVLRLWRLSSQSLWLDEGFSLTFARTASLQHLLAGIAQCNTTECYSPVYPLLLHQVIGLLGESEASLRGPSAIAGIIAVAALVCAARRLFDARSAMVAGLLSATSSYAIWYSQEARAYSLLLMFGSIGLFALACLVGEETTLPPLRYRLLLAVSMALGVGTNVLFGIGTFGLALSHLLMIANNNRWWRIWWPSLAASALPVAYFAATQLHPLQGIPPMTAALHGQLPSLLYVPYGLMVGITLGPPTTALRGPERWHALLEWWPALLLAGAAAMALSALVVRVWNRRPSQRVGGDGITLLGVSILVMVVLSVAIAAKTGINWLPRHAFMIFPPAVLLVAVSIADATRSTYSRIQSLAYLALALFVFANGWSVYNYRTDARYGKDDYRLAATVLRRAAGAGYPTVLLAGSGDLLRFYGDSLTTDMANVDDHVLVGRVREKVAPSGEVVVAINREFYWLGGKGRKVVLGPAFEESCHLSLHNFDLYLMHAHGSPDRPHSIPWPANACAEGRSATAAP
jgi:4-amino-4-deoxy-L-arabinose transferase-like glycosyltransferase